MILKTPSPHLLYRGSWQTRGFSPTAFFVAGEAEKRRQQQRVFEELERVTETRLAPNWDAYQAEPVSDKTYGYAHHFLMALPFGMPPPAVGAEPDGHLTFEWYRTPHRTLSVSVSPEGELHYAVLIGRRKFHGTEPFDYDIPETLLTWIREVYAE